MTHEITGPYTDERGEYWDYRGWKLTQGLCVHEKCDNALAWSAYAPEEYGAHENVLKIAATYFSIASQELRGKYKPETVFSRHVAGDRQYFPASTIEACIDRFEAEVERQFTANLAEAVRGL